MLHILEKGRAPLFFLTKLNSLYARVVCWNWKLPSSSGVVANAKSLQTNDRLTEGPLKQVIRKNCMIFQFRWCKIVILKQRVYQNCKKKNTYRDRNSCARTWPYKSYNLIIIWFTYLLFYYQAYIRHGVYGIYGQEGVLQLYTKNLGDVIHLQKIGMKDSPLETLNL